MNNLLSSNLPTKLSSIVICLMVILCGQVATISAQDLSIEPTFYELEIVDEATKKHGYSLTNNTQETIIWYWTIELADDWPADWEVQVCDLNLCYNYGIFSSSPSLPNPLEAGVTTNPEFRYVNVRSNGQAGTSSVKFNVFRDPEFQDLILSTSATTSTDDQGIIISNALYPNPASNGFYISNDADIKSLSISTPQGEQLKTQTHQSGQWVDTTEFPDGRYFVTLYKGNNQPIGSEMFMKVTGK